MPGRGVIVVTSVATAATAILDFALTGGLSYFFDLTFVVICLVAAMAVRGHDLFTTGVLPPIAFGADDRGDRRRRAGDVRDGVGGGHRCS